MGIWRFTRGSGVAANVKTFNKEGVEQRARNEIRFDSSPKRSICMQFGWSEELFELRNERPGQRTGELVWDVYAGNKHISRKQFRVGELKYVPATF
jgi:hypothetical protein